MGIQNRTATDYTPTPLSSLVCLKQALRFAPFLSLNIFNAIKIEKTLRH